MSLDISPPASDRKGQLIEDQKYLGVSSSYFKTTRALTREDKNIMNKLHLKYQSNDLQLMMKKKDQSLTIEEENFEDSLGIVDTV